MSYDLKVRHPRAAKGAICGRHFGELKSMVDRKGMGHMVRPEKTAEFLQRWLRGVRIMEEFDPLAVAALEINVKAKDLGIYVIPGACTLCTVNKALQNAAADAAWIDNITDLMLLVFKTNNMHLSGVTRT